MRSYGVSFEVAGPAAIFTRPDSGSSFVSYEAPTYSALKGMFECVVRWKSAFIQPTRAEICNPIQFMRYATNYGGPLRNSTQIAKRSAYQLFATVLVGVCYKVHGVVVEGGAAPGGNNHLHALQDVFNRRLKQGRFYQTPCLGWSEFTPSYFGPLRDSTHPREDINLVVPSMLYRVFDRDSAGQHGPQFKQNVQISGGELVFAE
jgi:CRISPR-associated protein Cas5d